MFGVLRSKERRRLLVALLDHNPREEYVAIPDEMHDDDKELEILHSKLWHSHLPRLEEEGFIGWDRDNHQIHKGPQFDEIRPLLELIENHRGELPDGWL